MFFRVIFVAFACFIGWAIYSANTGQTNAIFAVIRGVPYGDKIAHFLLMGTLALLANLALGYRSFSIKSFSFWLGTVLVIAFVVLEELTQIYMPLRTFDLGDLAADMGGIMLLSWLGYKFLYSRKGGRMA